MPPKTRPRKVLKENNIKTNHKTKSKTDNTAKVKRKPLADKTNSASDENVSLDVSKNTKMPTKQATKTLSENQTRPRRDRKLPTRFIEGENKQHNNQSLEKTNEAMSQTNADKCNVTRKSNTNLKKSPFKSPQEVGDASILDKRPKRVHRLPSRFEDHSISPSKFIPVTPCFASTPIAQKQREQVTKVDAKSASSALNGTVDKKESPISRRPKSRTVSKTALDSDGNNNAKQEKQLRSRQVNNKKTSPVKTPQKQEKRLINTRQGINKKKSPLKSPQKQEKRLINKSYSFRILEEKVQSPKKAQDKLAVYEFTFDPAEEPPPQKKKKKRIVRKRAPPKPKVTVIKNNYEANISKSLLGLKQAVSKTPVVTQHIESTSTSHVVDQVPPPSTNTDTELVNENMATEVHDQINYSPVASPASTRPQVKISAINETRDLLYNRARSTMHPENIPKDPLNLLEELSFCDEPIASSSMNTSVRHPLASPWRAEFNNLPLKWRDNTYTKPNMTPAVECSIINSFNSQKKHVYTNIVPETAEELPDIVTNDNTTNWKQTSILSFIKEVVEKSEQKKLKAQNKATHKKTATPNKSGSSSNDNISNENNLFCDNVNTSGNVNEEQEVTKKTPSKRKIETPVSEIPAKSPRVELNNTENFFGFDEIEDQENISPQKSKNEKARSLRSRSRAVLKEINTVTGPSRAKIPLAAKSKLAPNSDVMNKLFDNMMSATDAPELTEEAAAENVKEVSSVTDPSWRESMEQNHEENSVHLFEDIDVVHHLKPTRKSYGNCKKVTFMQKTVNTDTHLDNSSDENDNEDEDSNDLPFEMPTVKTKKAAPKKKKGPKLTKKEEDEVEAWAAAFNSMCEDVDQFPLLLE